jgi:hypothetical protein
MNRLHANDGIRRGRRLPQWLGEEWVWEGLLVVLIAPVIVHAVLSGLGVGGIA